MKVFFIEFLFNERWHIASSYDYSYFVSRDDAELWLKNHRDSVPSYPVRVSEYVRVES